MLSFLPLKTPDGAAAGLIRIENDAAVLSVRRPFSGVCTLFLEEGFVRLTPGRSVSLLSAAVAAVGIESGRPVFYATAPACTLSLPALLYRLSLLERPAAIPSQPVTASVTPDGSVSAPKQATQTAVPLTDPAPAPEQVTPAATVNGLTKDAPACDTPFCDAPSAHSTPPSVQADPAPASERSIPADTPPCAPADTAADGVPACEPPPLQADQAAARDTAIPCPSSESGADAVAPAFAASDNSAEQPFDLEAALLYFDADAPHDAETHAPPSIEQTAADTRVFAAALRLGSKDAEPGDANTRAFAATLRRACSVFSEALAEEQLSPDSSAHAASPAPEGLAPSPARTASAPSACPACTRGNSARTPAPPSVLRDARSCWRQETERLLQENGPSRGRNRPDLSD